MKVAKTRAKCCFHAQIAAVLLFTVQAVAQTSTGKAMAEIDLKPLGVRLPEHGSISATAIELLLISDSHLALLEENDRLDEPRNAHLKLYEIREGTVRTKGTLDLGEMAQPILPTGVGGAKVLEWVDQSHFVFRGLAGRWICNTDLACQKEKVEIEPIPFPHVGDCRPNNLLGLIDTQRAVCLVPQAHTKWSAIVMDSSGHHLYKVEQGVLPWDATLVSSVQGERFGLEWKSNTAALQLLNPLACIDECPPAGRQQFSIFNSSDGRKLQTFEWDPHPYNLYVLPALSPSGKTAAFVRVDKLAIYSLPSLH